MVARRHSSTACSRRSVLGTAGSIGVAGALAACGVPGAAPAPPSGLKEVPATLRYLTWYGGQRRPTTDAWVAAFNDEWPKVTVEVEETPLGEFRAKFQVQLAAGTPPDVVLGDSHAQTKWFDSGAHLDMGPLLARDKINIQKDYALVGIEFWCGKTYAVPFFADANAVFYNKTLLQRAGLQDPWADGKGDWSLADLFTMAERVTEDTDGDGKPDQWGIWTGMGSSNIGQFVWTRGGDVYDFQRMRYTVDNPVSLEAHQQVYDWLLKDRIMLPSAEASEIAKGARDRDAFSAGKVAFRFRAVNDVVKYTRQVAGAFEWDVIHFPKRDDRHPGVPLGSGSGHCVVKASEAQEQAYQLVKLISTDRGQEIMAQTLGLPALKSKQEVYLKQHTPPVHVNVFHDMYNRPYGIHFRHHNTRDASSAYGQQMKLVQDGKAPLVGALQEANRLMNDLVAFGDCQPYQGITHPIQPKT